MQNIRFSKEKNRWVCVDEVSRLGFFALLWFLPSSFSSQLIWNRGIKTPSSHPAAQLAVAPGKTWPRVAPMLSWQWQERQGTFCSEVLVGNIHRPGPLVRSHQPSDAVSWKPAPIHNKNQSFFWWAESQFMKLEVEQSWGLLCYEPRGAVRGAGPPHRHCG